MNCPNQYARAMVKNQGSEKALKILTELSHEFIGKDRSAFNPHAKFYSHAKNVAQKLQPVKEEN